MYVICGMIYAYVGAPSPNVGFPKFNPINPSLLKPFALINQIGRLTLQINMTIKQI